jgi:serine/threonine protein kinase
VHDVTVLETQVETTDVTSQTVTGARQPTSSSSTVEVSSVLRMVDEGLPPGLRDSWQINPSELKIEIKDGRPVILGVGGFGKVYKGILHGVREVAVKVAVNKSPQQTARFLQEIAILRACHDPGIVRFLGATVQQSQTLLVMEYMPGGDLYNQIKNDSDGEFLWYQRGAKLAQQIAAALVFLHSHRIMHLDLKTPNILLASDLSARIADVGLGEEATGSAGKGAPKGSFLWAAPEQLAGEQCSPASDMWSFGTILWELVTGERPVGRDTPRPSCPEQCPEIIADLIQQCHNPDPTARPDAREAYHAITAACQLTMDLRTATSG